MRFLLLLGLAIAPFADAQRLAAVAPRLPGGVEGFAVEVPAGPDAGLAGFALTDGEGTWRFPEGAAPGRPVWVASDPAAWQRLGGPPALGYQGGRMEGNLRLADGGDHLALLGPDGRELDRVAWGNGTTLSHLSEGTVFLRDPAGGWMTPRIHRIGESSLDRPAFTVAALTLYASPDSSHAVLQGLMAGACRRLHLHVYELRSATLADGLAEARRRCPGLDLQVLVDGSPVGQTAAERHATADALARIEAAGGQAWTTRSVRYDDHHLKVLVADDAVAVQSENWVDAGVPPDPTHGNRGWGVVVHDRAAADWFAAWLAADRAAWDTERFGLDRFDPTFQGWPRAPAPRSGAYGPVQPPLRLEGSFTVRPLVAPDHTADPRSDPVAALVEGARTRVLAQQLDLGTRATNRLGWSTPDPYLEALAAAARRGVEVTVVAQGAFGAEPDGNLEALRTLAEAGAEARTFWREGTAALHNKGTIVDGAVVVGSLNANHHSRSANREAAVVLEGPGVADYYAALFASDLEGGARRRDPGVILRDLHAIPSAPVPILLAAMALVARRRC